MFNSYNILYRFRDRVDSSLGCREWLVLFSLIISGVIWLQNWNPYTRNPYLGYKNIKFFFISAEKIFRWKQLDQHIFRVNFLGNNNKLGNLILTMMEWNNLMTIHKILRRSWPITRTETRSTNWSTVNRMWAGNEPEIVLNSLFRLR